MARAGNNNLKGSVRVELLDRDPPVPQFVAGTNSGAFESIERVDVGEYDVTMDDNYLLSPPDIVQPQIEGAVLGSATINIATTSTFKVRVFAPSLDPTDDLPFSLRIVETFRG